MPHNANKAQQEVSLIGRMLSMEALILVMGCLSLAYGIAEGKEINIFWGVLIIIGFFVLRKVRKKDWAKHWEEMEALQKARQAREALDKRKSADDTAPKA
ncbi:MAG TPA: hypothetical protein VF795_08940 [Desulfuromonadaceae bacterium]